MIAFLANHLLQSTAFAAVAWLLTTTSRKHHARARYWLWLSASLTFLIPYAVLVDAGRRLGLLPANVMPVSRPVSGIDGAAQPFAQPDSDLTSLVLVASNLPAIPADVISAILLVIWRSRPAGILTSGCLRWRRISFEGRLAAPVLAGREFEALLRVQGLRGGKDQLRCHFLFVRWSPLSTVSFARPWYCQRVSQCC
jgi:bla regulator protein BlaR1